MNDRDDKEGPLVAVARAVKTRGLRGEIVADILTDFPERFEQLTSLIAVASDGSRSTVELEKHWFQKDRVVFKFKGYDSVESAGALIGRELTVPESDRVVLEEGTFYEWEVQGCKVQSVDGKYVGEVTGVLRTGGVEMLVVNDELGHEHLIPMAASIVKEIDVRKRQIIIDPPEGLLEL